MHRSPLAHDPHPRSCHWRYRSLPSSNLATSVSELTRPGSTPPMTALVDVTLAILGSERTSPAYATTVMMFAPETDART